MEVKDNETLAFHLSQVLQGKRRFESAAQAVYRMIIEAGVEKITRAGETTYEYKFFRQGERHIVGWYDEINSFVNFVREAAEGGATVNQAFVLVGEPGNGKTFFVDYICRKYREFLARPENTRYTFQFVNLHKLVDVIVEKAVDKDGQEIEIKRELKKYGNISTIQSQTFEDPVILAMNLFESQDENREYLAKLGFDEEKLDQLYANYRPLGACTDYIWNHDIREYCNGDIEKMLEFVRVVPVSTSQTSSVLTGEYSAGDKITSSATELRGEGDITRELHIVDPLNPYRYNVTKGVLARAGGGGIHFADELFKNKKDLINIYIQVIQPRGGGPRRIELYGHRWPIDILIVATSNNEEYKRFISEEGEGPIKDRCLVCYVSHNTDYKLQHELTRYAIGSRKKYTVTGEPIHEDPNFNYALSVAVTLTRLPHSNKLTPIETMKLEAGETAGEKSIRTLAEIKKTLNASQDVTKRWGQKGIGHRGLERIVQRVLSNPETHEGKCKLAKNVFEAVEREINDYVSENVDREKYLKDLKIARALYKSHSKISIYNAYRDDPDAIRKDVANYINMIIGIGSEQLGPDKTWHYTTLSGEIKSIKIDERYIDSVEARLGLTTKESKEAFRNTMRKLHGQKMMEDPNYDFMDQESLVKAVTEVRLESDVAGAASLIGALTNRTNEENMRLYNRMIDSMLNKLGYCKTCAISTIEVYCKKDDES